MKRKIPRHISLKDKDMYGDDFYDCLARHYDLFQSDLDPSKFAGTVHELIARNCHAEGSGGNGSKILCDLGCGNGRVDVELKKLGYDVMGIDSSSEMLSVATEKDPDILWIMRDITDFELYSKSDVFVSLLDTVNHITDKEALSSMFTRVFEFLNDGGVFIFDIATSGHFEDTLGDQVFFEDYDDVTLLWDNSYDEEEGINEACLTLFERDDDGRYVRSDGVIEERYYNKDEMISLGEDAGLKFIEEASYDGERTFLVFGKESR